MPKYRIKELNGNFTIEVEVVTKKIAAMFFTKPIEVEDKEWCTVDSNGIPISTDINTDHAVYDYSTVTYKSLEEAKAKVEGWKKRSVEPIYYYL